MAKIATQFVFLKVSKLVKENESDELHVVTDEIAATVADAVEQLVPDEGCLVEVADVNELLGGSE